MPFLSESSNWIEVGVGNDYIMIKKNMDVKLKEILNSINDRFSGPQSCKIQEMLDGKMDFDDEEVKNYLVKLRDFGGYHGNNSKSTHQEDVSHHLKLFTEYLDKRNKSS